MVPPLKNEDLITEIWLLSKNKSVRAADDRSYADTETVNINGCRYSFSSRVALLERGFAPA